MKNVIKKAVTQDFLKDLNQKTLEPFLTPPFGTAGTLLEKPIENFPPALKESLKKILKDARLELGDFVEKIPFFFVIPHSREMKHMFFIDGLGPNPVPILIIKKTKNPTTFHYINFADGTLVYANTPEMANIIEAGYEEQKSKAAERKKIAIDFIDNIRYHHQKIIDLFHNEKMNSFMKGNVTNLIPAIPMLKKCLKIIEERIQRQENISKTSKMYYDKLKRKKNTTSQGSAGEYAEQANIEHLFDIYEEELKKELSSGNYSKDENDLFRFMFLRYRSRSSLNQLDKDVSSNIFDNAIKKLNISKERFGEIVDSLKRYISIYHQYEDEKKQKKTQSPEQKILSIINNIDRHITEVSDKLKTMQNAKILPSGECEKKEYKCKNLKIGNFDIEKIPFEQLNEQYRQYIEQFKNQSFFTLSDYCNYIDMLRIFRKRAECIKRQKEIPSDDEIFELMPPLKIDSFADVLPGRFRGYQSKEHYTSSFREIYENVESRKLKYFKIMKDGTSEIIDILENHLRNYKTISVCSFSPEEMRKLRKARENALALFGLYNQGLVKANKEYNKSRIGSIFETTVEDTYMFRYIAVTVRYIEIVFSINCKKEK